MMARDLRVPAEYTRIYASCASFSLSDDGYRGATPVIQTNKAVTKSSYKYVVFIKMLEGSKRSSSKV